MKTPVYLDYHATTPVDPRVFAEMEPYLKEEFGNPASQTHERGRNARKAIEKAREQVAALMNAEPVEITFTSGATESNNWCLKGLQEKFAGQKNHLVTSTIEHSCVLDTAKYMESKGVKVDYLPVNQCGLINLDELREKITKDTFLVSIMAVNNEIGTINDAAEIAAACHEKGALFHTDGTQAVGYLPFDVKQNEVDYLSMSSHKIYGPKGVGALFHRKTAEKLPPFIHGGGHERGLRSGTVNVPAVVGFGKAAELALAVRAEESERIKVLRDRLHEGLAREVSGLKLNGHKTCRTINNLNVSFKGVEATDLIAKLRDDVMVSSGSACASSKAACSHVLQAIGIGEGDCYSNIRFSVGRFTTEEEIDYVIRRVAEEAKKLSPASASA